MGIEEISDGNRCERLNLNRNSDGISVGNSIGNETQHVEFICEFPMEMIIIRVFYT